MTSNRRKAQTRSERRLKELQNENELLRSKLAKQKSEENSQDTSWIEDGISRGLAFIRKKVPDFESKGGSKHFVRVALCMMLLSSEKSKEKRDSILSFSLNELNQMSKWWIDDEKRMIDTIRGSAP